MNIRDLQYLVALSDCGHFGKAAEQCFVSQPALSMQLKKLEEHLGVCLIERSHKILLTEVGQAVCARARHILAEVKEIQALALAARDPWAGTVHLAIIPTIAPYLVSTLMPRLKHALPQLQVYLQELQTSVVLAKLQAGEIDCAILALPVEAPDVQVVPVHTEAFLLAVPKAHALARRKQVRAAELKDVTVLLLEEGHCLRQQALSFCANTPLHEARHFQATSLETLRHMVAAGLGLTLMPEMACLASSQVAYIPFQGDQPQRTLGLVWRNSSARYSLFEALAAQMKVALAL